MEGANNDFEDLRDNDYLFKATAKPHGAESCVYYRSSKSYECRFNYKTSKVADEYQKMISNITRVIPANFVWKKTYEMGGEFREKGEGNLRRIQLIFASGAERGRSNIYVKFRQARR